MERGHFTDGGKQQASKQKQTVFKQRPQTLRHRPGHGLNHLMNPLKKINLFLAFSALLILIQFFYFNSPTEAADFNSKSVQNLESFVSNPPNIKQMTFQYVDISSDTNYCIFRWQKNAYLFEEYSSKEDMVSQQTSNLLTACGRFDGFFWYYDKGSGISEYQETTQSKTNKLFNPVLEPCEALAETPSVLMNMGIANLEVGSIKWTDGSYSNITIHGYISSGSLNYWSGRLTKDGEFLTIPLGLSYSVRDTNGIASYPYYISYSYETDQVSGALSILPKRITTATENSDKKWAQVFGFYIYEMETNESNLSRDWFTWSNLNLSNRRLWVYTNSQYLMCVNGDPNKLKTPNFVLPGSENGPDREISHKNRRAILFGFIVFFNLFALCVVFVKRKKQTF